MDYFNRGALTAKSYSFVARPWEFKNIDSVDFFDSVGSVIRIDVRGDKVIRVIPRVNDEINNEWISDKIRFAVDGFRNQRIDSPLVKLNEFAQITWAEGLLFLTVLCLKLIKHVEYFFILFNNGSNSFHKQTLLINYLAGAFTDFDDEYSINTFLNTFFCLKINPKTLNTPVNRKNFFLGIKISDITKYSFVALVGLNVRYDCPVFNIRLRQHSIKNNTTVVSFGVYFISTFSMLYLGGIKQLYLFCTGSHWLSPNFLRQKTLLLANELILNKIQLQHFLNSKDSSFRTVNVLTKTLTSLVVNETGTSNSNFFLKTKITVPNVVIFNSLPVQPSTINNSLLDNSSVNFYSNRNKFWINFSHHGDVRLGHSDLILPTSALFERESLVSNIEGRACQLHLALSPPKNALTINNSFILLLTLFFKLVSQKKQVLFLHLVLTASCFIQDNTNILWNFIEKFLIIHKDSKVPVSSLIKQFQILSVIKTLIVDSEIFFENFTDNFNKSTHLINQFTSLTTSNTISNFSEINTNYYVQDEISLASFSLISANERLLLKSTYY